MNHDVPYSFFIFLIFALFFLLKGLGKKQEKASSSMKRPPLPQKTSKKQVPTKKQEPSVFLSKKEETKVVPLYSVEKKERKIAVLTPLKKPSSLREAFVLSEILKRFEERELF